MQSDGGSSVSNVVVMLIQSVAKVADLESPFCFLVIQLEELVEVRAAELRLFRGDEKTNLIRKVTLVDQVFGLQHYQSTEVEIEEIAETHYDSLFQVRLCEDSEAELIHLKYGQPTPD